MSSQREFVEAAYEAAWMCRLSESRLLTPVDPRSIDRHGIVPGESPWKCDYTSHLLAQQRLLLSAEAINEPLKDSALASEVAAFRAHWEELKPLRNVMQHPKNTDISWRHVFAFYDRIEYRHPVSNQIIWSYSIEELHSPVETLYAAVIQVTGYDPDNPSP